VLDLWRRAGVLGGVTDTHAGLSRLLATDPAALLLARSDAIVIGSLIAAWDGWRGSFYRLAVDPGRRREGIATALLREGERRLLELGAVRLTAIVADDEPPAMDLWRSAGYERQPGRARFVRHIRRSDGS
jgi:ribosomal protein S18 acetylase RimI-like enzyme